MVWKCRITSATKELTEIEDEDRRKWVGRTKGKDKELIRGNAIVQKNVQLKNKKNINPRHPTQQNEVIDAWERSALRGNNQQEGEGVWSKIITLWKWIDQLKKKKSNIGRNLYRKDERNYQNASQYLFQSLSLNTEDHWCFSHKAAWSDNQPTRRIPNSANPKLQWSQGTYELTLKRSKSLIKNSPPKKKSFHQKRKPSEKGCWQRRDSLWLLWIKSRSTKE